MALTVETWPTSRLIEYARNPRKNDEQVDRMCAAIREFGFRIPIVAKSDGSVVDGHLRLKAARKLGIEEVPVALADELSDEQIKAFRLLANQSANWAAWDVELLKLELAELDGLGFDLALTGFDDDALAGFLADKTEGLTDPDDVPDAPVNPVTRPGDVWLLGRHRLVCGDSTDADVARKLEAERADLLLSDPPYGIGYEYESHDDSDNDVNAQLVWDAFSLGPAAKVWTPGLPNLARDIGRFGRSRVIVWFKKFAAAGNGLGGASTWEPILTVGHTPERKLKNDVLEIMTDREQVGGVSLRELHTCPKPVALYAALAEALTKAGQAIYEPFSGSGTTIIACEQTGRDCRAVEITPAYVDVAVKRWQQFTGKEATLEGDGRTFAEIAGQRHAKEGRHEHQAAE